MQVELPGITLVGTAHVSPESVAEVRDVIQRVKPAIVSVELDHNRKVALTDKKRFEETPITDMLRSGRSSFILAQSMLASYQRRMGAKHGIEPGAEMLAAIQEAEALGAEVSLADRDIGITLRRAYALMGFREKVRLSWEMLKSMVGADDEEDVEVEDLMKEDVLSAMMGELAVMAPSVSRVLVSERDAFLASNIHEAAKRGTVVAVLGAGHLKGVEQYLRNPDTIPDKSQFEVVPKPRVRWGFWFTTLFSLAIVALFAYFAYQGFVTGDWSDFRLHLLEWVICTGGMCALGAAVARGHPFAVLAGFIAAPLKPIRVFFGSGLFVGLAQAKMTKPTVKDFHEMSRLQTMGDLFRNRVTHVLMVTSSAQIFANLGMYLMFPLALKFGIPFVTR
ncbi:MAG TPA: TraB/GumN family protein [Candidatus Thermoplasmatota archaeon]|nr:TraB/GumN family protein [Candidatus Thermoplasmatota archaeon]